MKLKKLTFEQHKKLGKKLHQIRTELMRIDVELARYFGKTKSPGNKLSQAIDKIDKARCELDSNVYKNFLRYGHKELCKIYYPGTIVNFSIEESEDTNGQ